MGNEGSFHRHHKELLFLSADECVFVKKIPSFSALQLPEKATRRKQITAQPRKEKQCRCNSEKVRLDLFLQKESLAVASKSKAPSRDDLSRT